MDTPPPTYPDISKMQQQQPQPQQMPPQQSHMMPPQQQMPPQLPHMMPPQQQMPPHQPQMMTPQHHMMPPQQQMPPHQPQMMPPQHHMMQPPPHQPQMMPPQHHMMQPPQQQPQMMMQQPMPQRQMHLQRFTKMAAVVDCPYCQSTVQTMLHHQIGCFTWLIAGVLAFFLWWCIFPCFIPFFSNSCKDVEHFCPNCYRSLGKYSRI